MSIARKVTEGASGGSGGSDTYVDDVFSTYLYEGTSAARDIVNGIDLDDKGGLVWLKSRTSALPHYLFDTERGANRYLVSNETDAEVDSTASMLTQFNADGFSLGDASSINGVNRSFASWTFAKQKGFFDVVTYTGNGVAGREIPHNLGSDPGMIITKVLNITDNWAVYHASLGGTERLTLNNTDPSTATSRYWNNTDATDSVFTVGVDSTTNGNGNTYVAYLFADDAPMFGPNGDESIIKCGSYTGTSAAGLEVDLGWEPQWVMIKSADDAYNWFLFDAMRGIVTGGNDALFFANEDLAEGSSQRLEVTSTGFKIVTTSGSFNDDGRDYIYMAIRRPNKPAEEFEPDELFAVESADGAVLPQFKTGWPVDFALKRTINGAVDTHANARLIQGSYLKTNTTDAADTDGSGFFDFSNGWRDSGAVGSTLLSWMFRRAPGFFDVVTYEGANSDLTVGHNLGVVPEMMWVKCTNNTRNWAALMPTMALSGGSGDYMQGILNRDNACYDRSYSSPINYLASPPTDNTFELLGSTTGGNAEVNNQGWNYIAFLWASVPGICDIGTYTGNGQARQVDCGFTNGARFVLVKRTDGNGNWLYFDSLRGKAQTLALNTTDPSKSGEAWTPYAPGFQANVLYAHGDNWNPNVNGAEYIYMAIA